MHKDTHVYHANLRSIVVAVLLTQFEFATSLSPLWDSVKTHVHQEYDVQEGNQIWVVRLDMGEHTSTDLVVGEDIRPESRVILTCTAHHGPAEWVYSGDGKPDFKMNTTIENLSPDGDLLRMEDMRGAKRYVATLTLGLRKLTTKDTGRYNCMTASPETGLKYKTLSAFYHLFVPGQKLFIRQGGEKVVYDLSKSAARIPCGVTNPKTSVTLQKLNKGNLEFIPNENMFYHPISGYYPKKDIPGTYLCTGAYNNTFQLIHFTLTPTSSPSDLLYHQNTPYNNKRKSTKTPLSLSRPEDLEWLIYSSPTKNRAPTKKPTEPITTTTSKPSKSSSPTKPYYIPFHIRYSSTTYAPFYTFHGSSNNAKPTNPNRRNTGPPKFNPSLYPIDMMKDKDEINSVRPPLRNSIKTSTKPANKTSYPTISTSNNPGLEFEQKYYSPLIPHEIISYRPVFNFFKDTSRPTSATTRKPTVPVSSSQATKETTTRTTTSGSTSPPSTRTTVRKYRPTTTTTVSPTTPKPVTIPDTVICSQSACGTNAECFVHHVYYEILEEVRREAACKCTKEYIGNPYLECYPPTPELDQDILYFNSSFRSPLIPTVRSHHDISPDGDDSYSSSSESQGVTTRTVGIIDM